MVFQTRILPGVGWIGSPHYTTTLNHQLQKSWYKSLYRLTICRYRLIPTPSICRCNWRQYNFIPTDGSYTDGWSVAHIYTDGPIYNNGPSVALVYSDALFVTMFLHTLIFIYNTVQLSTTNALYINPSIDNSSKPYYYHSSHQMKSTDNLQHLVTCLAHNLTIIIQAW
jgi:hypothetical protein